MQIEVALAVLLKTTVMWSLVVTLIDRARVDQADMGGHGDAAADFSDYCDSIDDGKQGEDVDDSIETDGDGHDLAMDVRRPEYGERRCAQDFV